jgi:hypothetical protein
MNTTITMRLRLGCAAATLALFAASYCTLPDRAPDARIQQAFSGFGIYAGTLRSGKGDLASIDALCGRTWPNVPQACRIATGGTDARRPVRTVTVERRHAPAASTLISLPLVEMAQR